MLRLNFFLILLLSISPTLSLAAIDDSEIFKQEKSNGIDDFAPQGEAKDEVTDPNNLEAQDDEVAGEVSSDELSVNGIVTDEAGVTPVEINDNNTTADNEPDKDQISEEIEAEEDDLEDKVRALVVAALEVVLDLLNSDEAED